MIISLTGKIGTGKDTVAKIIQIITQNPHFEDEAVLKFLNRSLYPGKWKNRKWADKLKDIVCLLLNCTREQLEDREFKERELGPEWEVTKYFICDSNGNVVFTSFYEDVAKTEYDYYDSISSEKIHYYDEVITLTPRLLLQLIGTDCMRNMIHPNIWVNSLLSDYKEKSINIPFGSGTRSEKHYPNWIISDTRFPNELEAVKKEKGLLIKIVRYYTLTGAESNPNKLHYSETALDYFQSWDYIIVNNSDLLSLIKDVRQILITEELI